MRPSTVAIWAFIILMALSAALVLRAVADDKRAWPIDEPNNPSVDSAQAEARPILKQNAKLSHEEGEKEQL